MYVCIYVCIGLCFREYGISMAFCKENIMMERRVGGSWLSICGKSSCWSCVDSKFLLVHG